MNRITFKGSGQLNGVVVINKSIEVDDQQVKGFKGQNRNDIILATLAVHYPGVKINPHNIGVNIEKIQDKLTQNKTTATKRKKTNQSTNNEETAVPIGNKLDQLLNLNYTDDLNDTQQKLELIALQMVGYRWKFSDSEIVSANNQILNQCLEQYKTGFHRLQSQTSDIVIINYYKKKLNKLRLKKIINRYWAFILGLIFFLIFGIVTKFH